MGSHGAHSALWAPRFSAARRGGSGGSCGASPARSLVGVTVRGLPHMGDLPCGCARPLELSWGNYGHAPLLVSGPPRQPEWAGEGAIHGSSWGHRTGQRRPCPGGPRRPPLPGGPLRAWSLAQALPVVGSESAVKAGRGGAGLTRADPVALAPRSRHWGYEPRTWAVSSP